MSGQLIAELLSLYSVDGQLDREAFRQQVNFVAPFVTGLFVGGLAGDGMTLCPEDLAWQTVMARDEGRGLPVWQGVLPADTETALQKIEQARRQGAIAVVVCGPVGHTAWALATEEFWSQVITLCALPLIIYDEPKLTARCPVDIVIDLLKHPQVIGYKDSTRDVIQAAIVTSQSSGKDYYSGSDGLTWPLMAMGACGVISLLVDPFPKLLKLLVGQAAENNVLAARDTHQLVVHLRRLLTHWPNQDGYKIALQASGIGFPSYDYTDSSLRPAQLIKEVRALHHRYCSVPWAPWPATFDCG